MDRNEAASVIRRYLTCTDITHSCNGKCEKCRYHTSDEEKELALKLAIAALEGKDTNVPTSSALDHIHNVVAENEYKRGYKEGYEQGKKDATPKWIPVSERLPKEEGHYLVTDEAAGMTETIIDEYMCCDDGEWTWLYSQHAIAWMPMVEPWKGK